MTVGEKNLARSVYRDGIDYDAVRIHKNGLILSFPLLHFAATAPNDDIFFCSDNYADDFSEADIISRRLFIHELMHVYQHQHGTNLVLKFLENAVRYRGKYQRAYDLPTDGRPFAQYNIEQQARTVDRAYFERERLKGPDLSEELRREFSSNFESYLNRLPPEFNF